jgi:hypothetical protein
VLDDARSPAKDEQHERVAERRAAGTRGHRRPSTGGRMVALAVQHSLACASVA